MAGSTLSKLLFYTSAALLNAAVLLTIFFAHAMPAFTPQPAIAAVPIATVPAPPQAPTTLSGKPVRVVVPSQAIDLPIDDGLYDAATATWTLSNDRAYYATPTVPANDKTGSTLIYGHNIPAVFGNIHTLAPGSAMQVYTENGMVFHYKFSSAEETTPDSMHLISSTGAPNVILQTCSGIWSEWRKLFTFELVKVEKV